MKLMMSWKDDDALEKMKKWSTQKSTGEIAMAAFVAKVKGSP